jgi:hypothetical protein
VLCRSVTGGRNREFGQLADFGNYLICSDG